MAKKLNLTFTMTGGKEKVFAVSSPKLDLTAEVIKAAAAVLIDKKPMEFLQGGAELTKAEYKENVVDSIEL